MPGIILFTMSIRHRYYAFIPGNLFSVKCSDVPRATKPTPQCGYTTHIGTLSTFLYITYLQSARRIGIPQIITV